MLQAMEKYDATQALAIVMNPKTGELLSFASVPTFHPAEYQNVDPSIYNRNLPVWMTFEPGSTFKILTLAAGLEEKVIDLHNEHFYDPGYVMIEKARLRCWKREGHKDQTFLEVVENSCNPGFVEMGQRLGPKKLTNISRTSVLGNRPDQELLVKSKGILFSEKSIWSCRTGDDRIWSRDFSDTDPASSSCCCGDKWWLSLSSVYREGNYG